jgi:hypothetical protein
MSKMLIPILSVLAVAVTFLSLGVVFVTSGEKGTIGIGLGIMGAILVIAGLRALEGYLARGGKIAGKQVSLPHGMWPFWLPTLSVIIVAGIFLGLGSLFILAGNNGTVILGLIIIVGILIVGGSLGRIDSGDMNKRLRTLALVSVGSVVGASFLIVALVVGGKMAGHFFWEVDQVFLQTPTQPIAFTHVPHVQKAGIDCVFCHRTGATQAVASIPPVQQCVFCHKIIAQESPEIGKLLAAWDNNQPIQWVRVHRLPDHVRFVHEAHITFFSAKDAVPASAVCSLCHGDVGAMVEVSQQKQLQMGFCVDCHRQNDAPTDCATCHY